MNHTGQKRKKDRHAMCAAIVCAGLMLALCGCSPQSVIDTLNGCKQSDTQATETKASQVVQASAEGSLGTIEAVTKGDVRENMGTGETMDRYNNGTDGICASYPDGQCTWWACMRGRRLGIDVGGYWGNGGQWASKAKSLGYEVSTEKAAAGAIVSFPAGVQGADVIYGHVAVVEKVDTKSGTLLISEMNVKGPIATSRVLPIHSGANYILPKSGATTTGAGKHGNGPVRGKGDTAVRSAAWVCEASVDGTDYGDYTVNANIGAGDFNGPVATKIYRFLTREMGFSGAGAAGALAVAYRESNFRPDAHNPGGGVAGIFQWSGWSNSINGNRITSEGSIRAGDPSTLTLANQLRLLRHELDGPYRSARLTVGRATDPVQAAKDWSRLYEGVALSDGQSKIDAISQWARQACDIHRCHTLAADEGKLNRR